MISEIDNVNESDSVKKVNVIDGSVIMIDKDRVDVLIWGKATGLGGKDSGSVTIGEDDGGKVKEEWVREWLKKGVDDME